MAMHHSSDLLKAARVLLGLKQDELAEQANIARHTLRRLEAGKENVTKNTVEAIVKVLEEKGIEFILPTAEKGPGIRWRSKGKLGE
ncbi:UNVERIFIED_ORG: transcriptional regulator with XRE-family HTH domain [Ensifer adhaerens]|nr:transcriptional regulator with XRE-family HTH domain [Ensifer adhaerens]